MEAEDKVPDAKHSGFIKSTEDMRVVPKFVTVSHGGHGGTEDRGTAPERCSVIRGGRQSGGSCGFSTSGDALQNKSR